MSSAAPVAATSACVPPRTAAAICASRAADTIFPRLPVAVELARALEQPDALDEVIHRDQLDLGQLLLEDADIAMWEQPVSDEGDLAFDAPIAYGASGFADDVPRLREREAVRREQLPRVLGGVRDELRRLAVGHDDGGEGRTHPIEVHEIGDMSRPTGVVVREIQHVAAPFVRSAAPAPDQRGVEAAASELVVNPVPAVFVFLLREVHPSPSPIVAAGARQPSATPGSGSAASLLEEEGGEPHPEPGVLVCLPRLVRVVVGEVEGVAELLVTAGAPAPHQGDIEALP
jgi:hypothetical protein